jgi:hypothetical protein
MDPDVSDTGFPASGGELPVEVPRLIRSTVRGREDEPILLPGLVGALTVGRLLLGAELDGGYTDIRQR